MLERIEKVKTSTIVFGGGRRGGMTLAMQLLKEASASRARELEAAIHRFRECGVEIERFSLMFENGVTHLCVDGVPRFSWQMTCDLPAFRERHHWDAHRPVAE